MYVLNLYNKLTKLPSSRHLENSTNQTPRGSGVPQMANLNRGLFSPMDSISSSVLPSIR